MFYCNEKTVLKEEIFHKYKLFYFYVKESSVLATHLATANTTNCYMHINYVRMFSHKIHIFPIYNSSKIFIKIKTFSVIN